MGKTFSRNFILVLIAALAAGTVLAEPWPGWRGPRSDGTSLEINVPTNWDPAEATWKTELPGKGHASPIVWGNYVCTVTSRTDTKERILLCIDRNNGKILWQQTVVQGPLEKIHDENSYASSTPVTDGKRVYVTFRVGDDIIVAAHDLATGEQLWRVQPGTHKGEWGFSNPPVLYKDKVIVDGDGKDDSFLIALNREDGKTLWRKNRTNKGISYSAPFIRELAGKMQLIQCGDRCVTSFDPDTGQQLWTVDGPSQEFVATPVYSESAGLIFISSSWPKTKLLAIKPDGKGNVTETHVAWSDTKGAPYTPSMIVADDFLISLHRGGNAFCYQAATGQVLWKQKLGRHHASPVMVNGLIFFINDDGQINVIKPGRKFEPVAKYELGEQCYASPAISNGQVFVRGFKHLFCFGKQVTSQKNEVPYRQISIEDYRDKVAGGWVGQGIGVMWGQWTEGIWQTEIIPFELEDWYRSKAAPNDPPEITNWAKNPPVAFSYEAKPWSNLKRYLSDKNNWEIVIPEKMADQDDLYIEFMFLHSIMKNGLDVTGKQIAQDWLKYLDKTRTWGANSNAYSNFQKGIWPPDSGHPHNSAWSGLGDAIDFQIESDFFGLINPAMPQTSNAWCDKVGHIMNYGDGVYAGMAMAAMYGEAFFEKDPHKLVEYSLKAIPPESNYAKMVRDVIALHKKHPDWKDAWKELQPKWRYKDGKPVPGLDVRINGAYVYMGLLYGGGDYLKSMNISMRCGVDSDCNPSSVAGILGTALGMKNIPDKWAILKDKPIDNIAIKDIYPEKIQWDDIIDKTVEVGKWNILQNGGYIENGIIFIPYQTPTSPPLEQTIWQELPEKK